MTTLAKALLADEPAGVRLVYGTATGTNTVTIGPSTTPVELPALNTVTVGDYCAILEAGADRLILGAIT